MTINPKNVLKILQTKYNESNDKRDTINSDEDIEFANQLDNLIKDAINDNFYYESFSTLGYFDESVFPDPIAIEDESEDDYEIVFENNKRKYITIEFEYKKRAVEFWQSKKKGLRSLKVMKHSFHKVRNIRMLYRWKALVSEGDLSRNEKLNLISKQVLRNFQNSCEKSLPIHDIDLKRWALKARDQLQLSSDLFKASDHWLHNFKIKHRIVSRKINKFVTKSQLNNKAKLFEEAEAFVEKTKLEILRVGPQNVYNSDQSGFNLEMHSGRTLIFKGTTKVETIAQSINSLTHSYTIQPFVSANGILKSPMLVVLQEKNGTFGPLVEKTIYKSTNIIAIASRSGKLTSQISKQWFQEVFLPNVDNNLVLCLDSWSGQTDRNLSSIEIQEKNFKILTIPAGTTGMIQPLDVYGFRPWKNFQKTFSDLIITYEYNINLHQRNNILKLAFLTHNQISSKRFINMFKYAWYKSGYISEKPPKCETPVQYCLKKWDSSCAFCVEIAIIKCAWCTKFLCINHFFDLTSEGNPHYCEIYMEN